MVTAPRGGVSSPVLVGREPEAARLARVLSDLLEHRARVVVISGEAGIGKSRLIDESLSRAAPEVRALRGECLALGSRIPYLPFAELLRDLVRQVPQAGLARTVGSARHELARLLPELAPAGSGRADDGGPPGTAGELDRLRLYEAFLQVAERVAAEQPTVFVIEDVQWIDSASLELLSFLAHALRQRNQAAVFISVRTEDLRADDPVMALLADLGRDASAQRIELAPLSADATERLVAAMAGESARDDAARIHTLSDGNPLFVEELIASDLAMADDPSVPPKLRDLLTARLSRVTPDVLAVLRVAAAAGRTVDERLLVAASGLSHDQVRRAIRVAADERLLTSAIDRPGYRFRHEILRAIVASQLLPDEAPRVHAAYARALAEGPDAAGRAAEIAGHWDAAGQADEAFAAHLAAGRLALETYAFEEARGHWQRALELWDHIDDVATMTALPRTALLAAAASSAAKAGDLRSAIDTTRTLLAQPAGLDAETIELARSSLRWYLWESGDIAGALAEAEAVVGMAELVGRWRANALAHMAGLLLYLRRTAEAARVAREALEAASAADATEERILAEGVLGWCLLLEGDVEAGLAAIRRSLGAAEEAEGRRLAGRYLVGSVLAHAQLATALELVGRFDEVILAARAGHLVAARQGVGRTHGSLLQASAARSLYQLGRWQEAAQLVEGALRDGAVGAGRLALLAVRARLEVGRGEDERAASTLADTERLDDETVPLDVRRWLSAAHAEAALWRGDPMSALTRLALLAGSEDDGTTSRPGARPAVLDASIPCLLALGARACADIALRERASGEAGGFASLAAGQVGDSLARVRRQRALATAWAGDLAIARAELTRAETDLAERQRRWRTALDLVRSRPYAAAYAAWRLAEATLARRDGRVDAVPVIEQGLQLARDLGAARLTAEVLELAQRARLTVESSGSVAGLVVSAPPGRRPFGLTARESEVLALVAAGLSNQEIADRLFISPKTASVHISNIYDKLGVTSRVAAAGLAHDLGLAGAGEGEGGGLVEKGRSG